MHATAVMPSINDARRLRQIERFHQAKTAREARVQATYDSQDVDAFAIAVFDHVSHLYTRAAKAPYKDTGSALNNELAAVVVAEVLRKLPFFPHEKPLTPITGNPVWAINFITKRRHLDLVARHWKIKTQTTDKEREIFDNTTALCAQGGLVTDDHAEILLEFLETLPEDQRELADRVIASGRLEAADRGRWRTITRRAAAYGANFEPLEGQAGSGDTCACHSCSQRSWTPTEVMRLVDKHGPLPATLMLSKRLPARRALPADWRTEPLRTGSYIDPWKSDGKRHNKAKLTDNFQPIPAKLYRQLEGTAKY